MDENGGSASSAVQRFYFRVSHPMRLRRTLIDENRRGYRLSAIGYRLSAIGYRLSAIGYRLSAIVTLVYTGMHQP
jgi:hypothetical protein